LALLVCAFARPELFLTFLICWILTYIFFFTKIKSLGKYDIALVVLLTGISVFTYVFFKTPFNNGDSARSIGVFLQHFAMNYSQWHHTNTPFWLDYADILRQNFDNHTSLKGIIQSNPEIIKKHFLSKYF
jgi:hypothetical protein